MHKRSDSAFTLVELVIVIAIIGILAAIAIPRFIDIRAEAFNAQGNGVISSVRSGILLVASKNQAASCTNALDPTFPPNLEVNWNNSCNLIAGGAQPPSFPSNCSTGTNAPCFELVIPGGVNDTNWSQTGALQYTFAPPQGATRVCTYVAGTAGTFTCP